MEDFEEDSDTSSTVQSSPVRKKKTKAKKGTFKCKVCKNVYKQDSFDDHMATHGTSKPVHKCNLCQTEYSKKNYLLRHIRNIHTERRHKFKCSVCDSTFPYESKRKAHEMVHTGEKPFKCDVCGKSFRAQYCFNMHMLAHSEKKPYKCAHCPYACRDTSTLRKHQAIHTGKSAIYQCTKCDKIYKAKWRLKTHIAEEHLGLNVRLTPCERCHLKFKSRSELSIHVRIVHERAKVDKCEICGKYMTNSSNMAAHLLTHSALKPFSCSEEGCDKLFRTKGDAKKHSITHHLRRKTPCLECGRRFARVTSLRRHELTQHRPKVKATGCDICGAKFYNDNYLLRHLHRKHSRNKQRYECDHCGLVTTNKPSIVMHLKYTHGNEKDLKCRICKRKYKRHVYLKMHYLKAHNLRYNPIQRDRVIPDPEVSVKEEPLDIEHHDLDGALENAEIVNAEDMTVTPFRPEPSDESAEATELSESAANTLIAHNVASLTSLPERVFDGFFIRHLKHRDSDNNSLEIQPKEDPEALELKRAKEEREKQLAEARENAIQECLENARKAHKEGAGQSTEAEKTKTLGAKRKRLFKKCELLLSCDVCGKECRGLAAFQGHSKTHSKRYSQTEEEKDLSKMRSENNSQTKQYTSPEQTRDGVKSGDEVKNNGLKGRRNGGVAKARLVKGSKVENLKEFYNENVKDLGIEFEKFVEICKKVKKDQ